MRLIRLLILSLPTLAIVLVAASSPATVSPAPDVPPGLRSYLRDRMGFSESNLRDIARGRAVARTLDSDHPEDVSILGAVRISAPPDWLLARLRNIAALERADAVLSIASFSTPPLLSDLDALALDSGDLAALQECRPGKCDVQLPASAIRQFREQVPWKAADAATAANMLARRFLFEWLQTYRGGGLDALGSYEDHGTRSLSEEFKHLLDPRDLPEPLPGFLEALARYPYDAVPGIEHTFYWSKVDFGLRPTVRLNHLLLMPMAKSHNGLTAVAATKQLFASHYFTSALELRFVIDDPQQPGHGFYLVLMTKSRVPGITGFLPTLIKRVIKGRARGTMERHLQYMKQTAELDGVHPRAFGPPYD